MRHLALLCTFIACACCASLPLQHPYGAQPLAVEGWYEDAFAEAKACARKFGQASDIEFNDLEWFVTAPGAMGQTPEGTIVGLYSVPNHIFLDFHYTMNWGTVKHESAHAAIKKGHNSHDDSIFIVCSSAI